MRDDEHELYSSNRPRRRVLQYIFTSILPQYLKLCQSQPCDTILKQYSHLKPEITPFYSVTLLVFIYNDLNHLKLPLSSQNLSGIRTGTHSFHINSVRTISCRPLSVRFSESILEHTRP